MSVFSAAAALGMLCYDGHGMASELECHCPPSLLLALCRAAAACTCRMLAALSRSSPMMWQALAVAPHSVTSVRSPRAWLAARSGQVTRLRLELPPSGPWLAWRAALCCAVCPAVAPWLQSLEVCDLRTAVGTGQGLTRLTSLRRLSLASGELIELTPHLEAMPSLRELRLAWVETASSQFRTMRQAGGAEVYSSVVLMVRVHGNIFPPGLTALTVDRVSSAYGLLGGVPALERTAGGLRRLEMLPCYELEFEHPLDASLSGHYALFQKLTALTHLHLTPQGTYLGAEPVPGSPLAALSSLQVLALTNRDDEPAQLRWEPSVLAPLRHLTALLMRGGWQAPPAALLPLLRYLWFHPHPAGALQPGSLAAAGSRLERLALPLATFGNQVPALRAAASRLSSLQRLLLFGGPPDGAGATYAVLLVTALRALRGLLPELTSLEEVCIDQSRAAEAALGECRWAAWKCRLLAFCACVATVRARMLAPAA